MAISRNGTIVFFSMDALGHIHPILSIAKELRKRGHRVIIMTVREFPAITKLTEEGHEVAHCIEASSASNTFISDDKLKQIMQPLIENFRKGPDEAFKATYEEHGACGKHLTDLVLNYDLIEAKLKSLKPDLIVYDHVVGIPCITTVAPKWVRLYSGFPSVLFSSYNDNFVAGRGLMLQDMTAEAKDTEIEIKRALRDKIRRFWSLKGSPDWPSELELTPTSPHLNFYLGPAELGLEQVNYLKPLPDVWFRLEHTIDEADSSRPFEIPQCLKDKPGKLIYFSLGTLVTYDIDLINRLLEILGKSPNKFIVSMGPMHRLIKLHPNMWGDRFVEQKAVLPAVDLFITHGGHNSIIEAMYYGCQGLIVLPVFADQFDSAQRVQDCGLGVRLNPYNCTQDELLGSIEILLKNTTVRNRLHNIGARLRSIKYSQIAADKLEGLINE